MARRLVPDLDGLVQPGELLTTFHEQIRLADRDAGPGNVVERVGPVRRNYSPDPRTGWSMIESPEGLGPDPDAAIAAQRDFFAGRGQRVEWKTYSYDEPADLGVRLVAAGFVRQDDEALLLGELKDLISDGGPPPGVTVRTALSHNDFRRIHELGALIWGAERWQSDDGPAGDLDAPAPATPDEMMLLAEESADGPVLCAARVTLSPGSDFAGMWGGNTHPDWRRRGLYRALLAARARWAIERGYALARVDASPDSEPILRRLGLHRVATTVPYVLDPAA